MKFKKIIALLVALATIFGQSVFVNAADLDYNYFTKLMNYISQLYIDEDIDVDEIISKAVEDVISKNPELVEELLKSAFSNLDKYSEYYTPEEYINLVNKVNRTFYGIGVELTQNGDYLEVLRVLEDGGAMEAGLEPGDKFVMANGENVVGATMTRLQLLLSGELNSEVAVTVLRNDREIEFKVKRSPVVVFNMKTVAYTVLPDNIGYIAISNFAENTAEEFKEALDYFDTLKMYNVVLDLRDNPGGYIDSAIDIAKMIVPRGVIARTVFRQSEKNETFYSDLKSTKYKFAVLINDQTASAAELLASAMKDSKAGYLVGKTTYGKGVIQDLYMMPAGGFKLTTGYYLSRAGKEIDGVGIEPNKYIANQMQRVNMKNYTPFDYKIKWKKGDKSESVRAAKERLKGLGFYQGTINDIFDEALHNAVYNFQKAMDLYPYGVLDISTQVRIENEFYVTEEEIDKQMEVAFEYLGGDIEKIQEMI